MIARHVLITSLGADVRKILYHVIKESGSGESFAKWIVIQSKNAADMGNINHSKALMPTARDVFHDVLIGMLRKHIATQPCLSILVDKVTANRRTVDVTVILTMVAPGAPASHILQSYVLGAPVVKEHAGDALSREIQETLSNEGVGSTEKSAAIAADRQYHRLKVPEKLLTNMRSED